MSVSEIYDLIESYQRKQELEAERIKQQLKMDAMLNSVLARQIGEYVSCLFSKDARLTPISELLPGLFDDSESSEEDSIDKVDSELMSYKAKMDDFAFWHNQRLKKGGRNNE